MASSEKSQDTFNHDKQQKSAILVKFLHWILSIFSRDFFLFSSASFLCSLARKSGESGKNVRQRKSRKIFSRLWPSWFFFKLAPKKGQKRNTPSPIEKQGPQIFTLVLSSILHAGILYLPFSGSENQREPKGCLNEGGPESAHFRNPQLRNPCFRNPCLRNPCLAAWL